MGAGSLSRPVGLVLHNAGLTGNDQLLQIKSLLVVRQRTLDHPDLRLQTLMVDAQGLGRRELIVEHLKSVFKGENVMSKGILHGPILGVNGLAYRKDITEPQSGEISTDVDERLWLQL